jgi:hypothetical protein
MRIVSFSLWGSNPLYCRGILDNLDILPKFYPGWQCFVFVCVGTPEVFVNDIQKSGGTVIMTVPQGKWSGLFHRFYPAADPTVERFISRDTDSRFTTREVCAVNEWIESGLPFHIMRDHRHHDIQILGGMWGCVGGFIPNIINLINEWPEHDKKGTDQFFLRKEIWPLAKNCHIAHDDRKTFTGTELPFKNKTCEYGEHVGAIVQPSSVENSNV